MKRVPDALSLVGHHGCKMGEDAATELLPSLSRGLVPSRTSTDAKTALLARTGFRVFRRLCGGVSRYHRV
jgi:hypothetical protein